MGSDPAETPGSLAKAIVRLGGLFEEIALLKVPRHCQRFSSLRSQRLADSELRKRYGGEITSFRQVLNQRLAGLKGYDCGRAGAWPIGDHLRARLRFVGEAASGARANHWYPNGVVPDYYVRYPAPLRGARLHLPYLFVQVRAGFRGACGAELACRKEWHPGPWRFMYGFTSYDRIEETRTRLSPSSRMALQVAVSRGAGRLLAKREQLEQHQGGRGIWMNASQGGGQPERWRLDTMTEQDLRSWAAGDDPGLQAEMTADDVASCTDRQIVDRVWELFDYMRSFGERVWELSRRTPNPTVFISYRHADFARFGDYERTVGRLATTISDALGVPDAVFWDNAIHNGDEYRLKLLRRAESAWLFIALIGPRYLPFRESDWCRREYQAAQRGGAAILHVSVADARPVDDRAAAQNELEHVSSDLTWTPDSGACSETALEAIATQATQIARKEAAGGTLTPWPRCPRSQA